jgi:hypothetical protein
MGSSTHITVFTFILRVLRQGITTARTFLLFEFGVVHSMQYLKNSALVDGSPASKTKPFFKTYNTSPDAI